MMERYFVVEGSEDGHTWIEISPKNGESKLTLESTALYIVDSLEKLFPEKKYRVIRIQKSVVYPG